MRDCLMPGFDGTGPMGMGPMTGGGRGFCIGYWPYPYWGRHLRFDFGRGREDTGTCII